VSNEKNKLVFQRFYEEVLNQGNLDVIDDVVDPNVVSHHPIPGQKPGAAGLKEALAGFKKAFPDLKSVAQDIIAKADKVVGRFTVTGTHQGEFMGYRPTGKQFTYEEIVIVRLKDGKIVEHWAVADVSAMMEQLGAIEYKNK
jgi:steroid delta-isomerase-like uncharacterized protein